MLQIPLSAVPNQSLSLQLDNNTYDLVIRATSILTAQVMVADITINNTLILTSQRCVPGTPLIPYEYLTNGNFIFITNNDEYPDYLQFQITQYLIYASQDELTNG